MTDTIPGRGESLIDLLRRGCLDPNRNFYGHRSLRKALPTASMNRIDRALSRINATLGAARVFTLEDAVTTMAAEISTDGVAAIRDRLSLARPPHPTTWIEWNDLARLTPLAARGYAAQPEVRDTARVGFLIETLERGGETPVYRVSIWTDLKGDVAIGRHEPLEHGVGAMSIGYLFDPLSAQLHDRMTPGEREVHTEINALETTESDGEKQPAPGLIALGGPFVQEAFSDPGSRAALEEIASRVRYITVPPFGTAIPDLARHTTDRPMAGQTPENERRYRTQIYRDVAQETIGDLRFLVSLLALINTQPLATPGTPWTPAGRMKVGMRKLAYLERRTVRLAVPRERALSDMRTRSDGRPRRAHEVRGAMCYSRDTQRACAHDWQPVTHTRETCTRCGGRRWWRRPHMRGDARIGLVTKDYRVTPQPTRHEPAAAPERMIQAIHA